MDRIAVQIGVRLIWCSDVIQFQTGFALPIWIRLNLDRVAPIWLAGDPGRSGGYLDRLPIQIEPEQYRPAVI